MMATLMIAYVAGFRSAEILPTATCSLLRRVTESSNAAISSSCRENARTTRAPARVSRVRRETSSKFFWIFPFPRMQARITK